MYVYIYVYIYILKIYIFKLEYIYKKLYLKHAYMINIVQMKNNIFLQKDAHRLTVFFASPELSVRVDFEG